MSFVPDLAAEPSPLHGVRVLDCATTPAGAAAAMHLADFGADVVGLRSVAPPSARPEWITWERGKRLVSIGAGELDDTARALSSRADIAIFDATPASMRRRALRFEDLGQRGELVHLWMPPTGTCGDWSELPADPILLAAVTAMASHQGVSEHPEAPVAPIVETVQGLLGALAAVACLIGRERGATRQAVASGLHAVAALQTVMVVDASNVVRAPQGPDGGLPNFRPYRCGDGSWIYLAALSQQFFLQALDALDAFEVMVLPGVDGEFTRLFDPHRAREASRVLAERFSARTSVEAIELLRDAGVPVAPVQSRRTWADSDTVRDNSLFAEISDPTLGAIRMPPPAADLDVTPGRVRGVARDIALDEIGWGQALRTRPAVAANPSADEPTMPLAGIRVLDLGAFVASPFAGSVMCDLGADVIKVEPPGGDDYRVYGASFAAVHQGKRGISIDLKTREGRENLTRLTASADVVIHNLRADARRRLGVDASALLQVNKRLVVCELSAWGELGELRDDPAFDPLLQARAGLMRVQGDSESPRQVRMPVHDTGAACMLALGGLIALAARQRIGRGQRVTTSMVAASLVLQPDAFTLLGESVVDDSDTSSDRAWTLRGYHRCGDGWIALPNLSPDEYSNLCEALGVGANASADPAATLAECRRRIESTNAHDLVERLRTGGTPAAPVLAAHHEYTDEYLAANEFMHSIADPTIGRCTVMRHYVTFPDVEHARGDSPGLGEHNASVLS